MAMDFSRDRIISKLQTADTAQVALDGLIATQPTLLESVLNAIETDPKPPSELLIRHRRDKPIVVEHDGKLAIWDGHHRLAVAYRKGMKTHEAYIIHEDDSGDNCSLRVCHQWGWGETIVVSKPRA